VRFTSSTFLGGYGTGLLWAIGLSASSISNFLMHDFKCIYKLAFPYSRPHM